MVGNSKCPKFKQNPLKIGCNMNQNSLRWDWHGLGVILVNYQWNLTLYESFFGVLHIFEYIQTFEYETERMSHIQIFMKPILTGHSSLWVNHYGMFACCPISRLTWIRSKPFQTVESVESVPNRLIRIVTDWSAAKIRIPVKLFSILTVDSLVKSLLGGDSILSTKISDPISIWHGNSPFWAASLFEKEKQRLLFLKYV